MLCLPVLSQTFNNELLEKIFISLTYFKTYIIYTLFPLVILLPDLAYNFIRSIYFPTPIDIIIYNQEKYREEVTTPEDVSSSIKMLKDPFIDYKESNEEKYEMKLDSSKSEKIDDKTKIKSDNYMLKDEKNDNIPVMSINNIENHAYAKPKLAVVSKNLSKKSSNVNGFENGSVRENGNGLAKENSRDSKSKNNNSEENSKRIEIEKLKSKNRGNTAVSINENMDFNLNEGKFLIKIYIYI